MLDIFISAILAVVTIAMAYLGVHVTLHPPNESPRMRRSYKVGFLACGVIAVSLVIIQGIRAGRSQRTANAQMMQFQQDVDGAKDEAKGAKQEVQRESDRRKQAERDLAIIIQASGQATRIGITQDLRKIPLKIEATGKPPDTPERRGIREALGEFARRGMAIRDKCARDDLTPKQIETEGQAWFEEVQTYLKAKLDSSYLSQFILTHTEESPSTVRAEMLPLWHGLNERIQTLAKFIDELK